MKKGLISLLGIFLIGCLFFDQERIVTSKKEVKQLNEIAYVDIHQMIQKEDEYHNPLSGVEFKMSSYKNIIELESEEIEEGRYEFSYSKQESTLANVYHVLSNTQKQAVESIHTYGDLKEVFGADACAGTRGLNTCSIILPTVFTIEETSAPVGYIREKRIIPGEINLIFGTDSDEDTTPRGVEDEPIELVGIALYNYCGSYYIEYGTVDVESLLGTTIEPLKNVFSIGEEEINELRIAESGYGSTSTDFCFPMLWENRKGTLSFEVRTSVNNAETITTKVNQTLEYKVVVKNTGDVNAVDNIVRSKLPEGFIYVEDTATKDGRYNDGYIEWNIPKINSGATLELTYKAYAPKDLNIGSEYLSEATIENFALDNKVTSNKAMVKLSLNNPSTGTSLLLFLSVLSLAVGTFLVVFRGYQEQKQH